MPHQLQTLHVSHCRLTLASLNIEQFHHLQCLTLDNCALIVDVRSLGHIYKLSLINCSNIVDISPLNHNTIITIHSLKIEDYSQSFEYSKEINLVLNDSSSGIPINLDRLKAVTSLKIELPRKEKGEVETTPIFRYTSFPSTLKSLHLKHSKQFYEIPAEHSLRELLIEGCPGFSLANIENIPSLTFRNCQQITDWKPLTPLSTITMVCSHAFIPFHVENVRKALKMEMSSHAFFHCHDLQNITHLKLISRLKNLNPFIERLTATKSLK